MTVPPDVEENLEGLRAAISAVIPPKNSSNLLIGTWNLRAFGDLTTGTVRDGAGDTVREDATNLHRRYL
ncbi:hypothetical protein [Mycetocola sp. 2940]|uniref:hypothetical protein n=1 Tax=Mycetocola sp. 2940 TaxID=3156452 RepID=UPI0033969138